MAIEDNASYHFRRRDLRNETSVHYRVEPIMRTTTRIHALVAVLIALLATASLEAQGRMRPDYPQRFRTLAAQKGLTDSQRLQRFFALDWEFTNVEYPEFAT